MILNYSQRLVAHRHFTRQRHNVLSFSAFPWGFGRYKLILPNIFCKKRKLVFQIKKETTTTVNSTSIKKLHSNQNAIPPLSLCEDKLYCITQ